MAYSLTSLVDKVRQTLGGAVAQAPKTLSGLGDRVSSNFNWAGQQAQQGASSFGKTLSQGLNTFDKGVTSLSNNPNPLVNFMPKAITSAANANIKYQQAVQSKPVTFSKSGLQNYIDQQRLKLDAGLKTASPILDVALAPTVGAATYLGSAGIGAAFGAGSQIFDNVTNKRNPFANVAQQAGYGFQQGLVQAPKISTIAGITNPVINQAAGKVLAKFPNLSEVGKAIVNRVIQGSLSVPEGIAMAKATGQDYNLTNAAIDFAVGSGLAKKAGTMAIEGPYGGGELGKIKITPETNQVDTTFMAIENALNGERLQKNSTSPRSFTDKVELQDIFDQMKKGVVTPENQYRANYILDKHGLSANRSYAGAVSPLQVEALKYNTPEEFVKAQKDNYPEYLSGHSAPTRGEESAPAFDLTKLYPKDIYSDKASRFYSSGYPEADSRALTILNKIKGNPNAEVTIYRAVPVDEKYSTINNGDWVTLTKDYAQQHGESNLNGKFKILEKKIKADELFTDANSIQEFGYDARRSSDAQLTDIWNKAQASKVEAPVGSAGFAKLNEPIGGKTKADSTYKIEKYGGKIDTVKGEPIKIADGIETFLHKDVNDNWVVSEATTGRSLTGGGFKNQNQAIKAAKTAIDDVGIEATKARIAQLVEQRKIVKPEIKKANDVGAGLTPEQAKQQFKDKWNNAYQTNPQYIPPERIEIRTVEVGKGPFKGNLEDVAFDKKTGKKLYTLSTKAEVDDALKNGFGSKGFYSDSRPTSGVNAQPQAPQVEPIGKVQPEVKKQPEILPWETPEYLAKNPSPAGTQPQSVAPSKLKQELNRPVAEANPKSTSPSITPELFTDIQSTGKAIDRKVNLLDYLRTPDRVLEKIGLKKQSDGVKQAYNAYLDELPKQIDKITGWYEQTKGDPNSAQKLFQYLDGNKSIQLDPTQQKVAGEMRQYLDQWAERLNLPVENRMANYMTHIFEKDFIQKEFDPELAKIIQDKIPGSVYDPFLQQRLGKLGYVEDAFRALDAYTKRAVRKANMDPALEKLKLSSESLDLQSWNYVKSYADRINLRPTEVDNLFDNAIKQSPIGYKLGQRPVTAVSRTLRQMVYRGTLGLNVGSALRNLTQGANTYAQLGEKYTGIGYVKALKEIATGGDELLSSGVLRDNVVQDRQLSAVKGVMEKLDSGLFSFFNFAEKINRGAAYFGAKAKYLSEGASETEAIKKAVDLTRKTQFTFGSVDTPVAMQSDLVKTFTQFQSFNMKQTEFLAEMVKNKEFTGIIRYVGANLLLMATVGQLIGMKIEDMIPFSGVLTGQTKLGQTPPVKLAGDVVGALTNAPDKYGNISKDNLPTRLGGVIMNNAPAFIPGGVQIKKTIQGLQAVKEGGSFSKTGKLQYPVPNDPITTTRAALFGKSNLPQAQKYFDSGATVLSDKQTQQFKDAVDKQSAYDAVIKKRADAKIKKSTKAPTLKLKAPKKAKKTATKSASFKKIKTVKAPKPKKITIKKYKPKLISYKPLKLGKIKVSLT